MHPSPFDKLDLRWVGTSSTGSCHIFSCNENGKIRGYCVPKGYRLYNSITIQHPDQLYLLECRNLKKRSYGLLAALFPTSPKMHGNLIPKCKLVLVQGIRFCEVTNKLIFHVHLWKKGMSLLDFANEEGDLQSCLGKYFQLSLEFEHGKYQLKYLNAVLGNINFLHPSFRSESLLFKNLQQSKDKIIECSLVSCDVWFDGIPSGSDKQFRTISLQQPARRYSLKKHPKPLLPWEHQSHPTNLLVVTPDYVPPVPKEHLSNCVNKHNMFYLPLDLSPEVVDKSIISFVAISPDKLRRLIKFSKSGITVDSYRRVLLSCGFKVDVILLSTPDPSSGEKYGGSIVCHLLPLNKPPKDSRPTSIKGIHIQSLHSHKNDLWLSKYGLVTMFRGYRWPLVTEIPHCVHLMFEKTYGEKGLFRSAVKHTGSFQMIGKRTSKQSSGTLVAAPLNTDLHEYYRENIDGSMVPLLRSIVNNLQAQAAQMVYTNGEALMPMFKRCSNENKGSVYRLSQQMIVTQNNFSSSMHLDNCFISEEESEALLSFATADEFRHISNIQDFMIQKNTKTNSKHSNSTSFSNLELPKATTCCLTLREKHNTENQPRKTFIFQYFLSITSCFAYDVSSDVLKKNGSIGSTFQSSLFEHATSVPVLLDERGMVTVNEANPSEYIFAFASNGKKT